MSTTKSGWAFPTIHARKCHYFAANGYRSLCGKYTYWGEREPDDGRATRLDCSACRKKLDSQEQQT